jgi:hypothetical protein
MKRASEAFDCPMRPRYIDIRGLHQRIEACPGYIIPIFPGVPRGVGSEMLDFFGVQLYCN